MHQQQNSRIFTCKPKFDEAMRELITERFGTLLKQENLSCIENELLIKDTCVLESLSPFFGYYDRITTGAKPLYLYLMLDDYHSFDEIHMAIFNIERKSGIRLDAVKGCISLPGNPQVGSIRIRNLERYDQIAIIQQAFRDEGIRFRRKTRDLTDVPGMIQLEKFFFVEDWGGGMYFDHRVAHHGYFEIPKSFNWEDFTKLTKKAKYDTSLLFFDAAIARFYSGLGYVNLVRIYKEHLDRLQLEAIRNRYLHLMS